MKLLLDESLPRRLKFELTGHEVVTVREQNWMGKKNGELLQLASELFDVFPDSRPKSSVPAKPKGKRYRHCSPCGKVEPLW